MLRLRNVRRPREGMTLAQFLDEFVPDETNAETWFVERRWPDGVDCPHCESAYVTERANRRPQPYWCHDCQRYFSVKTNSVTHRSPLSYRTWVAAVYLMLTSLKGVASTKLVHDLGISQKSAWNLGHRVCVALANGQDRSLLGPIEIDETYIGGKARNIHASQWDGKLAVDDKKKNELQGYLEENARSDVSLYSDHARSYKDLA